MKQIKINLSDKDTISTLKNILLFLLAIIIFCLIIGQAKIEYENQEIKERYEGTKENNTKLIKENSELINKLNEQNSVTNNIDTRFE